MPRPTLSLVLPVYNEEEVLPILHDRLQAFLKSVQVDAEVVFVNDGSTDRSLPMLRDLVAKDPRYKVVSFSRNFGHGNAITAGVDYARGHAVVIMDADLQDPPEVIVQMLGKWREGYDVVYGQRLTREGETKFKLLTSRLFYRLLRALVPIEVPLDTGDFRLMSRQVVVTLRALRETHRFIRGIVSWVGFKQIAVSYDRPGRAAGETKYPLSKMLRLAVDAITSFSVVPLRFATYLGMLISAASVLFALWAVVAKTFMNGVVPGWTATVVLVSLLSSVQLLMIGILGEYVGRIYEQVKGRPLYLVGETLNLKREVDTDELEPAPAFMLPAAPPAPLFAPISVPPPPAGMMAPSAPPPALGHLSAPPPAVAPSFAPLAPTAIAPAFIPPAPPVATFAPAPSVSGPPSAAPKSVAQPATSRGIAPSAPRSVPPPAPQSSNPSVAPRSVRPPAPAAATMTGGPRSNPPAMPVKAPRSFAPPAPPAKSKNPMKHTLIGGVTPAAAEELDDHTSADDTQPLVAPPSWKREEE